MRGSGIRRLRIGGMRVGLTTLAIATMGMSVGAGPSQAFNSAYCGGGAGTFYGPGNGCTSGRHTWGWNYVQWTDSGCQQVREYVYRDLTGTGLSDRTSFCPTIYTESFNDLDPYYAAGYLQRARGINVGSVGGTVYAYAQTCPRGPAC